jgi:hypothetical protein
MVPECLFLPRREFMRVRFEPLPAESASPLPTAPSAMSTMTTTADGHLRAASRSPGHSRASSLSSITSSASSSSAEIFIEAPPGETITKTFFLRRLAEALYGEPALGVAPLVGGPDDRPVVLRFAWNKSVNGGEHLRGPLTVYVGGLGGAQ